MDNINGLPDDVLLKILSFVPTKVAVSTCILSKRWEFLWMWLPKLEFIFLWVKKEYVLRDFIDKKLPLYRATVIERLCLLVTCGPHIKPEDIKRWIDIAVSRYVRELEIDCYSKNENIFPNSLFTCKSLVTLKLIRLTLIDVPSMVCLPSLKTLHLKFETLVDGKPLQQLLSVCPALEDLSVRFSSNNKPTEFTIIVPSLQSLSLSVSNYWHVGGYVIDTPSLNYLKLEDWNLRNHYSLIKNMPKLREAYVNVLSNLKSVIGSITSVKRLTIYCREDVCCDGLVFDQLEHLKICVCKDSSNRLGQLLKDSPNLRVLDLSQW